MKWFKITNLSGGCNNEPHTVSINIHGEIGDDFWDDSAVSASAFINAVEACGKVDKIKVSLATPGGNFFDGIAIANYLKAHQAIVEITILSEASSAGSIIAMSASPGHLFAFPASFMLVHDPATWAHGNSTELRDIADMLDTLKSGVLSLYTSRTGIDEDQIWSMLQAETLMTSEQMLAQGFIDEVVQTDMPVVNVNFSRDKTKAAAMEAAKSLNEKQKAKPVENNIAGAIIEMCDKSGVSFLAAGFVKDNLTIEQAKAQVEQASKLKDVCAASGIGNVSDKVVLNMNDPVAMLQLAVTEVKADADEDIDSSLGSDDENPNAPSSLDVRKIYNKRKQRNKGNQS